MTLKKQKQERKKLNGMDYILIFLALVLIAGAGGYAWYRLRAPEAEQEFICVLRIPAVERADWEAYGASMVMEGCKVRSENGTVVLGTVRSVELQPHMQAVVEQETVVWRELPALADIELEVRMMGALRPGSGVRVKDIRIAAGGRGSFRFGGYFAAGTEILSVEVVR